ncbi:MAG: UbiA family prenyltransferase [Pseudomonadota bacterium]|jgi:4-hydroxybenzoate polyprenyltransferase|uniref:UbiA family prenyltransferase n=1 Tax=unclassified Brevundimonas TaxID=2622653 RepID=UPI0007BCCEBB|nr:UbiA family prenyltransferase [Brevundimonas sp. GW460-12-10-14-LB2]ANC52223.1 4-hydroxybenzoate octaprenyltransferase [Brevundimonas sp. GW460-12-10-14-LB2]MEA3472161.1 UbiA family prenyltransferase [Pseudomonadota bacterium]MEE2850063.1 UbiA family prenyltransferase [Pseudomonadota bacterium]
MTFAPLPDAGANWVDRHAPEGLKPWLKLGRFDRPIGIWLLLLPGWQGIALALAQYRQAPGLYDLWLFVGFGIGACLMRAAGCAFNDIVDRDFDARVARTAQRPIPSGRISVKQAWAFVVACSLISLLVLLTLPTVAVGLGVGSLALVAAYPFMKRITWWPQAWLGLTFNWGALMGFAAALPLAAAALLLPADLAGEFRPFLWSPASESGHAIALTWQAYLPAVLLWIGGVFWTLGYDTIYALQDIEDDAMIGVKSSARRLASAVRPGVAVFYGLAVALAVLTGLSANLGPLFWLGLLIYAAHLARQVVRLDRNDGALALKLFKSNREAGLILLAAIALGSISL